MMHISFTMAIILSASLTIHDAFALQGMSNHLQNNILKVPFQALFLH